MSKTSKTKQQLLLEIDDLRRGLDAGDFFPWALRKVLCLGAWGTLVPRVPSSGRNRETPIELKSVMSPEDRIKHLNGMKPSQEKT